MLDPWSINGGQLSLVLTLIIIKKKLALIHRKFLDCKEKNEALEIIP
jgi:hypothetical protein